MILFSFGFPGRFAEWCDAVTVRLAQTALGAGEPIGAETLDDIALAAIRFGSPHLIVVSRRPGSRLRNILAQEHARSLIALEDPRGSVHHLIEAGGTGLEDATRTVANSCAAMLSARSSAEALVLRAEAAAADPPGTATAIARHFGLGVDDAAIGDIVAGLANSGIGATDGSAQAWWHGLAEPHRKLVAGALDPFSAHFAGGDLGTITWEPGLFYGNEEPQTHGPLLRPVDITGRARALVYGPYLALPAGAWSATVTLGFSAEAAEMNYLIEVFSGERLAEARLRPGAERIVATTLHFTIGNEFEQPLEIRVINERAAFDGRLALGYVALTPTNQIRPGSHELLTGALAAG